MKNNFGKIFKDCPYKREYIQQYMGVSKTTLSNWVTGKTTPTVHDLFKLAKFLDKKVDEFYEWEEEE
ncbi:helix-turn-helix domain-containing protein [Bacillus sp. 1P06AnD]|uniref:helix-turn-helix domain-containing protein n=1 Tax=Bacillus sp. 1P06AnD TaxID=3132208 RepID=UPI0039A38B98